MELKKQELITFCSRCDSQVELELVQCDLPDSLAKLMYKGTCKLCGLEMKQAVED